MFGLPLAFTAPALLIGLVALPLIWWLLRLTPPKPRAEVFPPLRILARVMKKEETPSKSPWWLTALRLAMAAFVVIALADPIFNPRENAVAADGPLAIVMDNGWSSAPDWDARVDAAERLIDDAEAREVPVAIVFTAASDHNAAPSSPEEARERLRAAEPQPLHTSRERALTALHSALDDEPAGTLAFLSDGLAALNEPDANGSTRFDGIFDGSAIVYGEGATPPIALTAVDNGSDAFTVLATRRDPAEPLALPLVARDIQGRAIAEGTLSFEAGARQGSGRIAAPFELRNDFARLSIDGLSTAGATYLLDDSFRRRRVALLSGAPADMAQPLLSPLYYIESALEPFADLVEPRTDGLSEQIPELLEARPSVLVMADIGTLPPDAYGPLTEWIEDGGMLLRFAGPRLAGAAADDPLVPVRLRRGERALGGSLSWTEPQSLAPYPDNSPFAGMEPPDDIVINRQVLAEPSPELAGNTWASLEDGTPLVTTRSMGSGQIVLFHVTAEATWSNLPISGDFVEMLRRTVLLSSATTGAANGTDGAGEPQSLPPYRLLDANGLVVAPSGGARPLVLSDDDAPDVSSENPPGLYGTEDGFTALNLMREGDELRPLTLPNGWSGPVLAYGDADALSLKPYFFGAAMILLLVDSLIVLIMAGGFARLAGRLPLRRATAASLIAIAAAGIAAPDRALAQQEGAGTSQMDDAAILEKLDATHIAYVMTGDAEIDEISERGLAGLSQFLTYRTSLEPGEPTGVDIESDELAFYPLIYWPMSADAPMPSDDAIGRIDAYMKSGGTVLFDTRDQFSGMGDTTSAETMRLRAILADLDIPPLEPVPQDHVLTKAFYLLPEFPGRYRSGEMWIEQLPDDDSDTDRSIASADGVSSVIITGNDLAGAWAIDENGVPMFPTVPADPAQREYAFRTGVNIMMYMLTGNYKTDQVHVPALLERLGQ